MIRKVREEDAVAIVEIYNYYLLQTTITFETEAVSTDEMRGRIKEISTKYPYFVYEEDSKVVGYSYANLWKKRCAYRSTVESTVYIAHDRRGHGIGRALMLALIEALRQLGSHVVIACITVPNPESVKLHEALGFVKVSHFSEVGWKFNQWLDVGDWELILRES